MERTAFHRRVIAELQGHGIPLLIGGSHALAFHAGATRARRDLDLMIRPHDWPPAERALGAAGIECRLVFPHWLGKAIGDGIVVDLIFSSGNGVATVDDDWFAHACATRLFGVDVLVTPPEELLWSKAFVMERERFDGADVLHLLAAKAASLDWARVVRRFEGHEAVLLAHLVLFAYVYPGRADMVPDWVVPELQRRAKHAQSTASTCLCRGTLLSRAQYLTDIADGGLTDGRRPPHGAMSDDDIETWTQAIEQCDEVDPASGPTPGPQPHQ